MRKETNNMLSLMLNSWFMSLCLIFSLIVLEQSKAIVEEYDYKSLYPMFLKSYHHLHTLAQFKSGNAN
jgi:hypothetical protein